MNFDLIIRGGTVVNGEASAVPAVLDIGITGDRITGLARDLGATAPTIFDAAGLVVAPGFIDVHSHSELALLGGRHRFGPLTQGVTTVFSAPDGFGWAPLSRSDWKELWTSSQFSTGEVEADLDFTSVEGYLNSFHDRLPINLALQVPHCAIRFEAMGWDSSPPDASQLDQMERTSREWFEAGARALCLGLDYPPTAFSTTSELVRLASVASEYGAIVSAHVRYNDLGREAAWRELIEIGRSATVPIHMSHERVDDVTAPLLQEDIDISFESYLYPSGSTHLNWILPVWAQQGGPEGLRRRLQDWAFRQQIAKHIGAYFADAKRQGRVFTFVDTVSGRYVGQSFEVAARESGLSLGEFGLKVLSEETPYALMVFTYGTEEQEWAPTLARTFQHPRMMVASDGIYHGALGHPRGYGCFPRALRIGVREQGAVSLSEAIHKMSGLPAARFGIRDRGVVEIGLIADLVVFDLDTISDQSTWRLPWSPPTGIELVVVNGTIALSNGQPTESLAGRVLR